MFTGRQNIIKCVRLKTELVECEIKSSGIANSHTIKLLEVKEAKVFIRKDENLEKINSFVDNALQLYLNIQEDYKWFGFVVGTILVFVGSSIIYALWQITVITTAVFDRRLGVLKIQKTSVYGKIEKLDYRLANIEKLWLEELDNRDSIEYSVNLKFNFRLDHHVTLFSTENRFEAETIARRIRQFLN